MGGVLRNELGKKVRGTKITQVEGAEAHSENVLRDWVAVGERLR